MTEIHNPSSDDENRMDEILIEESYRRERALRDCVSRGDSPGAREQLQGFPLASRMKERLPLNELRAYKNGLIILNTILRLSAEQGGLTPMMLHGISSDFARRIERIREAEEGEALRDRMVNTYCEAVHRFTLTNHSRAVRAAIAYILSHLDEKITLNTLAKEARCTPSYLSRRFQKEYGSTVGAYIRERRMDEARYLLIDTQEPLARIAEKIGYEDTSYFIRVFRLASGMTPGRYRNLYGKG